MKKHCVILIIIFCCGSVFAQEPGSGKPYAYRVSYKNGVFPVGNHVFRADYEYLNLVNSDITKPLITKPFFSLDETGVVLSREFNSGSYGYNVEAVEETDKQIIIYTKITTPQGMRTYDMSLKNLLISIRKTSKEIVIMEATE